jgi:Family of unknown function (DUF6069)
VFLLWIRLAANGFNPGRPCDDLYDRAGAPGVCYPLSQDNTAHPERAMTTTPESLTTTSPGPALVGGTAAGIVAAVVNALIFAIGAIDPSVETPAGGPIVLGAVITFSLVPNIIGGAVYWALQRWRSAPLRSWRIVVAIVTVVSFVTILGLEGAPMSMVLTLATMHLVAGAAAYAVTPAVAARRTS